MEVPYLDLRVNDAALKKELIGRVEKILSHGRIVEGPEQEEFEEKFASEIGVKYAVGVGSGSSALYLELLGLGIGPGDEVITTPMTFCSTINSIIHVGAIPVLVDIDPISMNIDPKIIEEKITSRTRCILPVHLYGQSVDMDPIIKLAQKYDLKIIKYDLKIIRHFLNN